MSEPSSTAGPTTSESDARMVPDTLNHQTRHAAKWSLLTELIARIIAPVTQLVLARLLTPEAFGVVATVVMVTSFAGMLSDAGFQKYLIQREFKNDETLDRSANVAFWSSMALAIILFTLIIIFRDPIAVVVGNPGLGFPLAVASFTLPLTVFVSIQQALFQRVFEYKKILPIRVGSAFVTLIVAVPLALVGFGFWSLILGVLASTLVNAIALTIVSPWKPRLFYSLTLLREMFAFSGWSLLEALSIWLTTWAGTFIVSSLFSLHELGLYRQPMTVVNSIFALVTSATTPILFSALSRLQFKPGQFRAFFLNFQFTVALFVLPAGVCAYFYRDFLTAVLFGPQWSEAALMFGLWGVSTGFMIVLSNYSSEVFRALGKPRISLYSQLVYMLAMAPALYFAAVDGFVTFVIVNAAVRVVAIVVKQVLIFLVAGIGFLQVLKNLRAPLVAVGVMGCLAAWLAPVAEDNWVWLILGIAACVCAYSAICLCFRAPREIFLRAATRARKGRSEVTGI